jgi:hypothetical protein
MTTTMTISTSLVWLPVYGYMENKVNEWMNEWVCLMNLCDCHNKQTIPLNSNDRLVFHWIHWYLQIDELQSLQAIPWLRCLVTSPLPQEAWLQSQASPCEIRGGQSGAVTGFLSLPNFSLSESFHHCFILIFIWVLLISGQLGKAWEPEQKGAFLHMLGSIG